MQLYKNETKQLKLKVTGYITGDGILDTDS